MKAEIDLASDPAAQEKLPGKTAAEAARLFRVHGALLIRNVFPVELVRALQTEFKARYESLPEAEIRARCMEVGEKRYMFTVALEGPFNDPALYASPRLKPILGELLGKDCVIQSFGAVCAFPGAGMQHLHRDHPLLFKEAGGINAFLPPYALHVVVPMVDLDEQTGTTALWEGSHRSKNQLELARINRPGADPLAGASLPYPRAGDCYLMDFRLHHRGTANVSDRARTILYVVYSRSWFQDHLNYRKQARLDIEPAEFRKIPEECRGLFLNARRGKF